MNTPAGIVDSVVRAIGPGSDERDPGPLLSEALEAGAAVRAELSRTALEAAGRVVGGQVYVRGIVEVSNICGKNCHYCGLRRDNRHVARYEMGFEEIVEALRMAHRMGMRSFLLQSGERSEPRFIDLIERVLLWTVSEWGDRVSMVLSLGELAERVLIRLRRAGGARYLLRIESSDPLLYSRLHPDTPDHSYQERLLCLRALRRTGWQTGSGVLIGVPGQTAAHLADDLLFMRREDIDMCGMGPYVLHPDTPMASRTEGLPEESARVELTLSMISLLRLLMPSINIAATTALQTLDPDGLRKGLMAGANVFMPNITPARYREGYDLYEGKASLSDDPESLLGRMAGECRAMNRELVVDDPGDPLHYTARTGG